MLTAAVRQADYKSHTGMVTAVRKADYKSHRNGYSCKTSRL